MWHIPKYLLSWTYVLNLNILKRSNGILWQWLMSCKALGIGFTLVISSNFGGLVNKLFMTISLLLPLVSQPWHAMLKVHSLSVRYQSWYQCILWCGNIIIPPPNEVGGGYTGFTLSVRLSVRPSVCRRHKIFSDVTFKIWPPYTPTQPSWRGVYWFHLVRPSVRPSVRLSVDDMVSGA